MDALDDPGPGPGPGPGPVSAVPLWRRSVRVAALALVCFSACGDDRGAAGAASLASAPRCEVPTAAYELATLSRCKGKIAVDDDHVYWLDGRLMRMPKCGSSSAPEVLLENVSARDLAVDSQAVYLADAYDVLRLDTHTLEPTVLAHVGDFAAQQIWVQNGWVYFTTEGVCIAGETWRGLAAGGDACADAATCTST